MVFDTAGGSIKPRAVTRFSSVVDSTGSAAPTVQAWTPLFGFPEPLSPHGSRMMTVWRYHDMGFGLLDESTINLDVEGLAWQPEGAGIQIDSFPAFEMALAHSSFVPDEWVDPATGGIFYPLSGLVNTFASNVLEPSTSVVHSRERGYQVQPLDLFQTASGTMLAPWPMNKGVGPSQFDYWTWRDTAVTDVAGPNGQGVDTLTLINTTGAGATIYGPDQVPTIGLPLLMEFKSWPNGSALGTNRVMMGMGNTVGLPYFRAWSGGFVSDTGQVNAIDPDQATIAQGGLDPAGNSIPGTDVGVMYGQADFVVRVSRAHTVWFDAGASSTFVPPELTPALHELPNGTQVEIAYRGATGVTNPSAAADATTLDPYGNPSAGQFGVLFVNNDASWHPDVSAIGGARYVQMRITLVSNAATGLVPEVTSLGLAYHQ